MPQIKQCYSLHDQHDDAEVIFMGTSTNKSTSSDSALVATTTTKSSAPSELDIQPSSPLANAANTKCIVYLSKAATTPHIASSSRQTQPGFILPVFKQSTRETAYAFLHAGGSHSLQAREGSVAEQRGLKSEGVVSSSTLYPLSSTGSNEAQYTFAPETASVVQETQPQPLSSENVQPNVAVQPVHEERVPFLLQHQNHVRQTQPTPATTSSAAYLERTHLVQDGMAGLTAFTDQSLNDAINRPQQVAPPPYTSRNPELGPHQTSQEAIFNPMSLYVKARLVPREVVTPTFGTESPAAMIDYIKTDAICNKELTKWSAKNVADFVASTDCVDKANLFLEQVCTRY